MIIEGTFDLVIFYYLYKVKDEEVNDGVMNGIFLVLRFVEIFGSASIIAFGINEKAPINDMELTFLIWIIAQDGIADKAFEMMRETQKHFAMSYIIGQVVYIGMVTVFLVEYYK